MENQRGKGGKFADSDEAFTALLVMRAYGLGGVADTVKAGFGDYEYPFGPAHEFAVINSLRRAAQGKRPVKRGGGGRLSMITELHAQKMLESAGLSADPLRKRLLSKLGSLARGASARTANTTN